MIRNIQIFKSKDPVVEKFQTVAQQDATFSLMPDIDKKILASSCEASSHPQPPAEHDRTSKEIAVES